MFVAPIETTIIVNDSPLSTGIFSGNSQYLNKTLVLTETVLVFCYRKTFSIEKRSFTIDVTITFYSVYFEIAQNRISTVQNKVVGAAWLLALENDDKNHDLKYLEYINLYYPYHELQNLYIIYRLMDSNI